MAVGSLTMACLMLTVGAGTPGVSYVNQRDFSIPIRIDPAQKKNFRELILYVSTDEGKQWQQAATAKPDKLDFPYYAAADGLYWFSVVSIDQKGNRNPPDIRRVPPEWIQRVIVDLAKPDVRITVAQRQGAEVFVRWSIQEEYPDLSSLRLEYRTADMPDGAWQAVQTVQAANGEAVVRPATQGAMSLRLQLRDLAGNVGAGMAEVAAGSPLPAPSTGGPIASPSNYGAPTLPGGPAVPQVPSNNANNGWAPIQPTSGQRAPAGWETPYSPIVDFNGGKQVVARTGDHSTAGTLPPGSGSGMRTPAGPMPAPHYVNNRRVVLDYEVTSGPSGVGGVQLYITRDDGRIWQPFGEEQRFDTTLPVGNLPSRQAMTIDLPEDGLYGFYIVVRNKAGIGKPPPQNGDMPRLRIELDSKAPEAELIRPRLDPAQRDVIILEWNAVDANLTDTPITLEWAERKGGTWTFIGSPELPNSRRFDWKITQGIPPHVFLRLTVRDKAGNVSVIETSKPITVDLNEPEVKFLGVSGSSR